jgi:hypothetical protein
MQRNQTSEANGNWLYEREEWLGPPDGQPKEKDLPSGRG